MSNSFYARVKALAESPHAEAALAAVAFAESSFFPVPPDILLAPMALADPRRAWRFALIATVASVIGGMLGYAIGALLYDTIGQWLVHLYGYGAKMAALTAGREARRDRQRPEPGAVEERHPGQVQDQPLGPVADHPGRMLQEPASRGNVQVTVQDERAHRSIADGRDRQLISVHRFSIGSRGLDDTN